MMYKEYLQTDHWKKTRTGFKKKIGKRCYICCGKGDLQVHYKRYSKNGKSILFQEKHTDLRLLYGLFHGAIHSLKFKNNSGKKSNAALSIKRLNFKISFKNMTVTNCDTRRSKIVSYFEKCGFKIGSFQR